MYGSIKAGTKLYFKILGGEILAVNLLKTASLLNFLGEICLLSKFSD